MELRFKSASCVAVGTFNIYIVQPPLLTEMKVLPDMPVGRMLEFEGDFTQPGVRFKIDDTQWTVRPERLAIESTLWRVDCGKPLALMLHNLCWTPVKAIGTNAVFVSDKQAAESLPNSFRLPQVDGASQRTSHATFQRGSYSINIQIAELKERLELSLNIHTQVSEVASQLESSEIAQQACNSFLEHREEAIELATELVRGEFVYDHAHAE